jgi:ribosomal protein S18 acetylase RimI-like enzyme
MTISLRNNKTATIRQINHHDREAIYNYLQKLSVESRSRFGPHPFDRTTIDSIIDQPDHSIQRYVALDDLTGDIVAYMLIRQGMIEFDIPRYAARNQLFDHAKTVTFAPSVADAWQSTGLGAAMTSSIEADLSDRGIKTIILWGGVQATNTKAVNFYKKLGYRFIASFWHDEKDNHDMVKDL